jgi:hypothetical protein
MAETYKVLTFDAATGESQERPMNETELAEHELVKSSFEDLQVTLDAKVAARTSALAKLAALGLTEEEIAAL